MEKEGRKEGEKRESDVGLAVRNEIVKRLEQDPVPINDRLIKMRIPLQNNNYLTIICVHAPTMTNPDEISCSFWAILTQELVQMSITGQEFLEIMVLESVTQMGSFY